MKNIFKQISFFIHSYPLVWIGVVCCILFLPGLGAVHLFDWDEINFAEAAREMILTGDWFHVKIDFLPFWEKPPLFLWLQATAMSCLGVGEYAARLPNALAGIISLLAIFIIGRKWYNLTFAYLWVGAYLGSVLPFLYFKSGIIDPWFNLFIFLGLYQFICFHWKRNDLVKDNKLKHSPYYYLFLSGLFIGLAILTKGPVAFLLVVLTFGIYWVYQRLKLYISVPQFLLFCLFTSLVPLLWFGLDAVQNGSSFIVEFIRYQYRLLSTHDAGHKGFMAYHFVVLLVGCFPASIFAIKAFFNKSHPTDHSTQKDFERWMKYLFWVVLIVFTIVQSKIVHYSSLCYFPLSYLAAVGIRGYIENPRLPTRWVQAGLVLVGSLYVLATMATPWLGKNPSFLQNLLSRDPFAVANLEANVYWSGWEMIPGVFLLTLLIFGIRYLRKQQFKKAAFSLFSGTAIFVWLTLFFYINRIEAYSQKAAIEFFKSKQGQNVYVTTYAYKSYAHLFYSGKPIPANPLASDKEWLINGEVDKDVYIVTKVNKTAPLLERKDMKKLGAKNGFVFFLRKARQN